MAGFDTSVFRQQWRLPETQQNALLRGLETQRAQQGNALQSMQLQALMQRQQQEQAAQAKMQQFVQGLPSPRMQASQNALAGGGGPTVANAQRMAPVDPRLQMQHDAMQAGLMSPMDYLKSLHPEQKLQAVGMDQNIVDMNRGGAVVTPGQAKPAPKPSAVQEFEYAQGNPAFDAWNRSNKKAGATSVSVNTGQKGLDNTLKLRGDFRSEPVYKAHQEMTAAYSQIQQSLKQQSPAGDLAGATKIMKLLDPGSVVRESELGMAMAASGLMDRVQNYAQNIISGNKLTPTQRADFQRLADALYGESVNQYNAKRGEYQGIAERNGLPVQDVLGSESKAPKPALKPGAVLKFDANGNMVTQ